MKKRVLVNIVIGVAAILFILILVISNIRTTSVDFATVSGSYGEQYAQSHHLNKVSLSDNQKDFFDQRYEEFDYDYEKSGIVIENYSGISDSLVIPMTIKGDVVVGIGEDFFDNLNSSVKEVILPETIMIVKSEPTNKVKIICTDESIFNILHGDNAWIIETRYESEFVDFLLGDSDFDYNINGSEIEITNYYGDYTDIVVIPSYINGYPVTKLSLDMIGKADTFVIPETVTSITGKTRTTLYSSQFVVQIIFTVIAIIISLFMVNVILPMMQKDKKEFLLSGSQLIATIFYVSAQLTFCVFVLYIFRIPTFLGIVISSIIFIIYISVVALGNVGSNHSKTVTKTIEDKTSFMLELKESSKNLANDIEDDEARSVVQDLVDEIRFSKMSDSTNDETIINQIKELQNYINEKDYKIIKQQAAIIKNMIKNR